MVLRNPIFSIYTLYINSDFYRVTQRMALGVGVATESQRGEVTSPGQHSWSEADLDSI